jgi:signal transduction histidine kinase/CheY-like chemotaxis protein
MQIPYQQLGMRWVKATYVPTHDAAGRTDGWVAVLMDTTSYHELEDALREADRRKVEFLAMLAHELRNPLAPIRNSLHILRLLIRDDPTADSAGEMMERQVGHMVRLVDDLMEVSRITRGNIELRKERLEVAAIVRRAVETSRPLIDGARHQLIIAVPSDPLTLEGDSVRLTQVIANLLNNAAKYTEAGGRIWLTIRRDGGSVLISVKDTGMGIAADVLPRIFEPFVQGERTTSQMQGGLGIGLTLVKRLVEMHGGSVEACSDGAGRGSEFVVRLPLVEDAAAVGVIERAGSTSTVLAARRVLVVDDNRDAAESMRVLLELLGAQVRVAYSGRDALDILADWPPAVVLLDIGMPGMDGHEVARRIRQQPRLDDVTLIALTGWGQDEDRRRSELAGFDYHLIKPADVRTLQTLLVSLDDDPAGPHTEH